MVVLSENGHQTIYNRNSVHPIFHLLKHQFCVAITEEVNLWYDRNHKDHPEDPKIRRVGLIDKYFVQRIVQAQCLDVLNESTNIGFAQSS